MTHNNTDLNKNNFPSDFYWGVSTSALQTEGAHKEHGKGPSIWDEFVNTNQLPNNDTHYQATNFYENYQTDINLVKELGIPHFRFSLSWPRIIPNGTGQVNHAGIDFYTKVIDYCLQLNITPWVTLYHWDLPLSLEKLGGWTNREILDWFTYYVEVCLQHFSPKVTHWMVLNEPLVFTGAGYFAGIHAPGKKRLKNFLPAAHHAVLVQALGYKLIKAHNPNAQVGTTFSCSHLTPYSNKPSHVQATHRMDALLNRMFIEPSLGLGYPIEDIPVLKKMQKYMLPQDEKLMKVHFDFIGIQLYTREVISYSFLTPYLHAKIIPANKRKVHHTNMNWEVYPDAIYQMVKKFSAYHGVNKIIITENGSAFHDELLLNRVEDTQRIHYLQKHIESLHQASQEFHKLQGYFVWSLTDNFEWAEGFAQRFGLVYIDYPTQKRFIKNSGYWYRNFLNNSN